MKLLIALVIRAVIIGLAAYLLPGVVVETVLAALVVAIVLGALNMFIKPLIVMLTLPVTILTMGLFMIVINAILVLVAAQIVPGFGVDGFWWAVLFSFVVAIIASFFDRIADLNK